MARKTIVEVVGTSEKSARVGTDAPEEVSKRKHGKNKEFLCWHFCYLTIN